MPSIIGVDQENSILLMEDLGEGSDYSFIYKEGKNITENDLLQLMDFAAELHNSFDANQVEEPIRNIEMRKLNHEHIYIYPYLEDNGINLDDVLLGLTEVAKPFKKEEALKTKVLKIGEYYLADGNTLLHGDYFPGSWLKTADGIKVIDPEFCFFGSPEFEIGVTVAHLKMADQPEELIQKAINYYQSKAALDEVKMNQFCAVEILRRIMGLAQLPLEIGLERRKQLLEAAASCLKNVE
jgi:5-methylthioribose kinase